MWIKASEYLLNSIPFRLCTKNLYKGDKDNATRAWILMQILVQSANGITWTDAQDLAQSIPTAGTKSCERVWEICVHCGVLRESSGCYSATSWLKESKAIGDARGSESRSEF